MLYRVAFDFAVTRRIAWGNDLAAFHGHVDRVREHIAGHEAAEDVRLIADIGVSSLTLDFVVEADDEAAAQRQAKQIVGLAIRESGARHLGLLTLGEEAQPGTRVGVFPNLQTPMWTSRQILIAGAA